MIQIFNIVEQMVLVVLLEVVLDLILQLLAEEELIMHLELVEMEKQHLLLLHQLDLGPHIHQVELGLLQLKKLVKLLELLLLDLLEVEVAGAIVMLTLVAVPLLMVERVTQEHF